MERKQSFIYIRFTFPINKYKKKQQSAQKKTKTQIKKPTPKIHNPKNQQSPHRFQFNQNHITKKKKKQNSVTWEEWEEYRKAVTEGKSEVEDMTERETRAKENWRKRRRKLPRVPGMPWKSLRVCRGIALSVSGGASTGWTAGWTIDITAAAIRRSRRRAWNGRNPPTTMMIVMSVPLTLSLSLSLLSLANCIPDSTPTTSTTTRESMNQHRVFRFSRWRSFYFTTFHFCFREKTFTYLRNFCLFLGKKSYYLCPKNDKKKSYCLCFNFLRL